MNNGIKIVYRYPCQKLMRGIYRLEIGNKFYIGKTIRLAQRMYQHQVSINSTLRKYPMVPASREHYLGIAKYLHENPSVKIITAEVIQKCVSEMELSLREHFFLKDVDGNPDCLNSAFFGTRKYSLTSLWDCEVEGDWLFYFDPLVPEVRYRHDTVLTAVGKVAKSKNLLKTVYSLQDDAEVSHKA